MNTSRRLTGLETEYGFAVLGNQQLRISSDTAAERLLSLARGHLPTLNAARGGGLYLGNGSRFYIDRGPHPEMATPELEDPAACVIYVNAGHELLGRLIEQLNQEANGAEVTAFTCNIDYSGSGATWASHENYLHRGDPSLLHQQLVPFLVSRPVFTGAGGLNPLAPGIELCLSPRLRHTCHVISNESTHGRGIIHTKDEPHSGPGWHRLHLLCGDTLLSHLALWLRLSVTGLIVRMLEAGLPIGQAVELTDPLGALHAFNADLTCRVRVPLVDGRSLTAIQIQRHYLNFIRQHQEHPPLPAWAVIAVSRWETVLDELASGSAALEQKLDWAIKRTLYLGHALRRGFAPEAIAAWNRVLDAVAHPNPASFTDDDAAHEALCRALFSSNGLRREANSRQRTLAAELGLDMKRLPDFLQLRQELCELEVRFGQLGPLGIFRALDEAGCLEHRIPEVSAAAIAGAVTEPPPSGRARVRADFIRAHAGQSDHFCEWSVLWKRPGKMQDLSDPFISEAPPWEDCPAELQDSGSIIGSEILSETQEEYDRGHYQRASELLAMATQFLPHWRGGTRARYHQLVAWVQCRRGFLREALTAADHLARLENLSLSLITDYICIHRFGGGLAPGSPEFWQWVQRGEELLARRSGAGSAATLKAHRGYVLARAGRLAEARADLEAGCQEEGASRVLARSMADLGDVCRMMGEVRAARRHLEKAEQIQRSQHFLGDLADHTLTHQAKLEKDSRRAAKLLRAARLIQSRWKNNLSLARTVLLEARICPSIWQNHRRRKCLTTLQSQVPALQHCPLLNRILTNWNVWCDGGVVMDSVDFFAGL